MFCQMLGWKWLMEEVLVVQFTLQIWSSWGKLPISRPWFKPRISWVGIKNAGYSDVTLSRDILSKGIDLERTVNGILEWMNKCHLVSCWYNM